MLSLHNSKQEIIDATDQCVMCGLCLPHCPTYNIAKLETESPRGRIALIRGLHEKTLQPKQELVNHLDNCLACMRCQSVCPTNISYEKILDSGREITRKHHTLSYKINRGLITLILTNHIARKLIQILLIAYKFLKVDLYIGKLCKKFPNKLRLVSLIPSTIKLNLHNCAADSTNKKTRVLLLNSCANDLFSDKTINAAKHVLEKLNCEPIILKRTLCCGSLHQHDGNLVGAHKLMKEFASAIKSTSFDVSAPIASGCGAHINRLPKLLDDKRSNKIANKQVELNSYIANHKEFSGLKLLPLPEIVWLHIPCTQFQLTNDIESTISLLMKIPGIMIKTFNDEISCCGAGGMNAITQTELADKLIAKKVDEIISSNANYLATSNFGCGLHFQSFLKRKGFSITVCHPIALIAQQLI